jgi:hypothetical protein
MALIIDPDNLNQGTEVTINPATLKITLNIAGNLSTDGVTLKCLYSFLKEEWKTSSTLIKYAFPITPITDEQFELVNGWDFGDTTTKQLIRTGGWALKDGSGVSQEEWIGCISLGSIGASDQVYYRQLAADGTPTNIVLTGPVNQAIQVYGDVTHGNFDYRSYLKLYVREQAKTYASSSLTDIGVSTLTYQAYRFPLANGTDVKVTQPDLTVDAYGVTITWYASPQQRLIGSTNRDFHVIIDGNNKTAEEIYMAVQSALRKATDIDAGGGTKTGKVTNELLQFVGDTLKTKLDSTGGVYIDNFQSIDTNRLVFVDDTGTERTFPYVAILTLNFGDNLVNDANGIYRVFFTNDDAGSNLGYDYGTANAITVIDSASGAMAGPISGQSSIQHTFDYDSNVQRGPGSEGEDAPITAVAIGLSTGQFVKATGTIQRSTANSVSLVAALERNYNNP